MKKLIYIFLLFGSLITSAQNGYRFSTVPGTDNTYTIPHKEIAAVSYSTTISLTPQAEETTYDIASLTGNTTINIAKTNAYTGDRVYLLLKATSSTRTVTWGNYITGISSTVSVTTAKDISILLIFDGSTWVESSTSNNTITGNWLSASISNGVADTVFIATPVGGTSPYTYLWTTASTSTAGVPTLTNATTGTVTITRKTALMRAKITDASGLIVFAYFLFSIL